MATWDDVSAPAAGDAVAAPAAASDQYTAIDPIASGIAGIESGGKYDAQGPPTAHGDRAYGKYQIMGANIPTWTQEALGTTMTPQAFLADPDAQEKTAKFQLKKLYDKHGNAKDVASIWHSGVPYDQAVKEGRKDALGTTTQSYADRVASGVASTPPPTESATPADAWDAISTPAETPENTSTTVTPTSTTPPPPEKPIRENTPEEAAAIVNRGVGAQPGSWVGRYTAAFGKPFVDGVLDAVQAAQHIETADGLTDVANDLIKLASPLAIPAQAVGEVVYQAGTDAGLDPSTVAKLATAASLGMGLVSPLPGAKTPPEAPLVEGGVPRATVAASKAKVPTTAQAAAELAPAGPTVTQAGEAAATGLESELKTIKDPVQGIYHTIETDAANAALGVDPAKYMGIRQQLQAIRDELGSTLTGDSKAVVDGLAEKLDKGQKITFDDLAKYKSKLDDLFPGKTPYGVPEKTRALYRFKWDVRSMMSDMLGGDDKDWFDAANAMWRDEVIPRQKLLKLIQSKDPGEVVERLFGNGSADKQGAMAGKVFRQLGTDSAPAEVLRQGVWQRALRRAPGETGEGSLNPKTLLSWYDKLNPDFRDAINTPGTQAFMDGLRKQAQATATTPGPSTLAKLTAKGLEIAGIEALGHVVPGAVGVAHVAAAGRMLLPPDRLAEWLADSKTANLLARALYTARDSTVGPVILRKLQQRLTQEDTKEETK